MSDAQSLNPDLPHPGDPSGNMVAPIPALTPPEPVVEMEDKKHYYSAVSNASMHTRDGTRITFRSGHYVTNIQAIQQYLDGEIKIGNTYIRHATTEEINAFNMRTNPVGTIEDSLRPRIEAEMRERIEAEIRAEMMGVSRNSDEGKLAGSDIVAADGKGVRSGTGVLMPAAVTSLKGIVGSNSTSAGAANSTSTAAKL